MDVPPLSKVGDWTPQKEETAREEEEGDDVRDTRNRDTVLAQEESDYSSDQASHHDAVRHGKDHEKRGGRGFSGHNTSEYTWATTVCRDGFISTGIFLRRIERVRGDLSL